MQNQRKHSQTPLMNETKISQIPTKTNQKPPAHVDVDYIKLLLGWRGFLKILE